MMWTHAQIQKIFQRSGVVTYEDLQDLLGPESKHTDTVQADPNPTLFPALPVYADEAAAAAGGLTGNEFYKLSDGTIKQKEPEVLP